jgi:hypothetical protein
MDSKKRFASRIEQFRLDSTGEEFLVCPLTARERARLIDTYRVLEGGDKSHQLENITTEAQAFIIARGLMADKDGARKYQDSEMDSISDDFLGDDMDEICRKILEISRMGKTSGDELKNSNPAPSGSLSEDSQKPSEGGTPTSS